MKKEVSVTPTAWKTSTSHHLFHLVPREICNDVNTNPNLARALPYFTGRNGSLAVGQGEDEKIFNLVYPLDETNKSQLSARRISRRREDGPFPAAFKMQIASTEEKHDKPEGNMAHA
ncbi:hypothetical protein V1478_008725 [Vespula squamosa]|uniref:Uncharacterized protein n=1 Tax=Vespula squamosa TaxID=30214 RepID=A0ABD2AUB9_VESSQ